MSSTGNVNSLKSSINEAEFLKLLNNSLLDSKQKELVLSIFTKISQSDGELSVEDWENFIKEADNNKDCKLSVQEIGKAIQAKTNSLYKQAKQAVIDFYNVVKNYIENKAQKKSHQNGSTLVYYAPKNPNRAKSSTRGTFDGNWVERDKYGSQTYEEWLKNNGYKFNEEVAGELEKQAKRHNNMRGYCAAAFMKSASDTTAVSKRKFISLKEEQENNTEEESEDNILNGELKNNKLFNKMESQGSAYQYASELAKNSYFKEIPHNIVSTMDLSSLPKGCVIVYDANYKTSKNSKHPHGHIAVTDGTGNDSGGGYYKIVDAKKATHIRVFIPIVVTD